MGLRRATGDAGTTKAKLALLALLLIVLASAMAAIPSAADAAPIPSVGIEVGEADSPEEVNSAIQVLVILTLLTLAPAFLLMMTSFTRIIIVLGFVRSALGTQSTPPNQVLIGIALFLTLFTMGPTFDAINKTALEPYTTGKISQEQAIERGEKPVREFMLKQTRERDIALFVEMGDMARPASPEAVPMRALIPAFMISELKTAFTIGFLIFIPFLLIDLVVASILMSMGMMMLPPVMISLPFKLLLFVLVDGWFLITRSLVQSFG